MATKTQKKGVVAVMTPEPLEEAEIRQWIAEKAYDLYMKRGGIQGYDVEDWLEAERRVLEEVKPRTGPKLRAVG
jgi:hypothetical protein